MDTILSYLPVSVRGESPEEAALHIAGMLILLHIVLLGLGFGALWWQTPKETKSWVKRD